MCVLPEIDCDKKIDVLISRYDVLVTHLKDIHTLEVYVIFGFLTILMILAANLPKLRKIWGIIVGSGVVALVNLTLSIALLRVVCTTLTKRKNIIENLNSINVALKMNEESSYVNGKTIMDDWILYEWFYIYVGVILLSSLVIFVMCFSKNHSS